MTPQTIYVAVSSAGVKMQYGREGREKKTKHHQDRTKHTLLWCSWQGSYNRKSSVSNGLNVLLAFKYFLCSEMLASFSGFRSYGKHGTMNTVCRTRSYSGWVSEWMMSSAGHLSQMVPGGKQTSLWGPREWQHVCCGSSMHATATVPHWVPKLEEFPWPRLGWGGLRGGPGPGHGQSSEMTVGVCVVPQSQGKQDTALGSLKSGRCLGSATGLGVSLGLTQLPSLLVAIRVSGPVGAGGVLGVQSTIGSAPGPHLQLPLFYFQLWLRSCSAELSSY